MYITLKLLIKVLQAAHFNMTPCWSVGLLGEHTASSLQGTYGKVTGSRPVVMLLSQILTVPLHQPLLGHMVQQRKQKPPQSASAIETLGSLLLNHPPVLKLRQTTLPQR